MTVLLLITLLSTTPGLVAEDLASQCPATASHVALKGAPIPCVLASVERNSAQLSRVLQRVSQRLTTYREMLNYPQWNE